MRTRDGAREAALGGLLDAILTTDLESWTSTAPGPGDAAYAQDPGWWDGLHLFALALSREWEAARALHEDRPLPHDDPPARWLRTGAHAWAASGDPSPAASSALASLTSDLPDTDGVLGRFAGYLYVEGALAHARLDVAQQVIDALDGRPWEPLVLDGLVHDFTPMVGVCRVRLLAFRGEVAAADEVYRSLPTPAQPAVAAVCAATGTLVRGNEADQAEVRRLARVVRGLAGEPRDHFTAGAHLLAAFGLVAIGDVAAAATSVLRAGRDADLAGCNVIDRALGLELLVALAAAEDDLDAALAWLDRAAPLLCSPIADSTVARTHCRVLLLQQRPAEAIVWAERAVARADAVARGIEAAEGRILLTRARLADRGSHGRRDALAGLNAMVAEAEARGHRAARRAAARELRPLGLRLRPLGGSGWAGLSAREAEVARCVAEGATNRQVARRLDLSEHTVRAHVSRVLAAFGVATRSGLPAAMRQAPDGTDAAGSSLLGLTARQEQVALLVAAGLSNRDIGERLDLSVRTVERHVGDILQRWSLPGRTAIARAVGERPSPDPVG